MSDRKLLGIDKYNVRTSLFTIASYLKLTSLVRTPARWADVVSQVQPATLPESDELTT